MARHVLTEDELARGRKIGAPLGGKAVPGTDPPGLWAARTPPDRCPRCDEPMTGRSWHSYLGHLGLHGLADNWFAGDVEAAQRHLRCNGLARQDPFPGNGAWPEYRPITEE